MCWYLLSEYYSLAEVWGGCSNIFMICSSCCISLVHDERPVQEAILCNHWLVEIKGTLLNLEPKTGDFCLVFVLLRLLQAVFCLFTCIFSLTLLICLQSRLKVVKPRWIFSYNVYLVSSGARQSWSTLRPYIEHNRYTEVFFCIFFKYMSCPVGLAASSKNKNKKIPKNSVSNQWNSTSK